MRRFSTSGLPKVGWLPTTELENESTGARLLASTVPGIAFGGGIGAPNQPPGPSDIGDPYGRQSYDRPNHGYSARPTQGDAGAQDLTIAWIMALLSVICGIPPLLWPILGINYASKAQAKGSRGANAARITCIVLLVLQVLGWLAYGALVILANGNL